MGGTDRLSPFQEPSSQSLPPGPVDQEIGNPLATVQHEPMAELIEVDGQAFRDGDRTYQH